MIMNTWENKTNPQTTEENNTHAYMFMEDIIYCAMFNNCQNPANVFLYSTIVCVITL